MLRLRFLFFDRRLVLTVAAAFFCLTLSAVDSRAALLASQVSDGAQIERMADLETVRQSLEREVVAQRLADFGLTTEQVASKLPQLSDEQLHQLAGMSDELAAGNGVEAVIGVLLIILLLIVILKLLDKRIIVS